MKKVFLYALMVLALLGVVACAQPTETPQIYTLEGLTAEEASKVVEITLSAFAFIVENVKAEAAPQIFGALFQKSVESPGPFFVHFAAHAIRSARRLPIKPLKMVYSRAELIETQNILR